MTDDEFLAYLEEHYTAEELVDLLIKHDICTDEDIIAQLDEYLVELRGKV